MTTSIESTAKSDQASASKLKQKDIFFPEGVSYNRLITLPPPIEQRGQTCKLYMLYYLMQHYFLAYEKERGSVKIPPIRKKIIITDAKRGKFFSDERQFFKWNLEKITSDQSTHQETTVFHFEKEQISLRRQAIKRGSKVGEVYDPRFLTRLAKDNHFNSAGFYAPEKKDYLDVLKACLHKGLAVGVFLDVEIPDFRHITRPAHKQSENEHALVIVGYYEEKGVLNLIALNWNKYTIIKADELLSSTYQLSSKRKPEIFTVIPNVDPSSISKWKPFNIEVDCIPEEYEVLREARPLLDDHISLQGKLFVLTKESNHLVKHNIEKETIEALWAKLEGQHFNQDTVQDDVDYSDDIRRYKELATKAIAEASNSESEESEESEESNEPPLKRPCYGNP